MQRNRLVRCVLALLTATPSLTFASRSGDGDDDCARRLEREGDDWSDAKFAAVAGEGIARVLASGHTVAQVWRFGPRTGYVIARLHLLDPTTNDLGLMVSAYVKDGRFVQMNELDPRICFGLTRGGEPDFAALLKLDQTLRDAAATRLAERQGRDPKYLEVRVGPKLASSGTLHVRLVATYITDDTIARHVLLARLSRADGLRLENLSDGD